MRLRAALEGPVALVDLDAHDGNGAPSIFWERADVVTGSVRVSAAGFEEAGRALGGLRLPTVIVQEGGYDLGAIGELIRSALHGIEEGLKGRVGRLVHDMHAKSATPPGRCSQSGRSPAPGGPDG